MGSAWSLRNTRSPFVGLSWSRPSIALNPIMSYDKPSREPAKGTLEECISEGFCRPKHRSSKDRSHWCKGRPGFIHIFERVPIGRKDSKVVELHERCMECGKYGRGNF